MEMKESNVVIHKKENKMDSSVERSAVTPTKSRLARTFAKVLNIRSAAGVTPADEFCQIKSREKHRDGSKMELANGNYGKSFAKISDERFRRRAALEALLGNMFASISTIKAAYTELQLAQFPYDVDAIQAADQMVVCELKNLSELKQCYLKKQLDSTPGKTLMLAEIKEQKSVAKTYEVMGKNLEFQMKLKDSEITSLVEKLEGCKKENRSIEKRLNASGQLSMLDNLHLSGLNAGHFVPVLRHAVRSIRTFVKLITNEMRSAGWNIDAAVSMIQSNVEYRKPEHKEMFDGFHFPNFSLWSGRQPGQNNMQRWFYDSFNELRSSRVNDYLAHKPKSTFAKFCRAKYLRLIHPKMESSFFGTLDQRNLVEAGEFPQTPLFAAVSEMAKRVWLLHCLSFSFDPAASIFQVKRGCRFSEVYMESLSDEAFLESKNYDDFKPENEPRVAFTVVPGFRIGKAGKESASKVNLYK
ncbi:GRAVITROPIC IN THE LIGHT 1-like protein [Drosera capensis]